LLFILSSWLNAAAATNDVSSYPLRGWLASREKSIFKPAVHKSRFAGVPVSTARQRCEDTQPPEALTTPNPVLAPQADERVIVSFIVGTDGNVHSPLILQGGGPVEDRVVLGAIQHWRYRPARCNGVPMEAEAKVEFSHR
jgi:Gram-negative bacterial TonB protein C-terminal